MHNVTLPSVSIGSYGALIRELDFAQLMARRDARLRKIDAMKADLAAELQRADVEWREIQRRSSPAQAARVADLETSLRENDRRWRKRTQADGNVQLTTCDEQPQITALVYSDGSTELTWPDGSKTREALL